MEDRLGTLLAENDVLYGVICRDATPVDIELFAQAGYHFIWLDLEHSPQSPAEVMRLCRQIMHMGMVPQIRIVELIRTHMQQLLDGGAQIITLPDVRTVAEAQKLVAMGKYPPVGQRGVSTCAAGTDYTMGDDPQQTLALANQAVHLMVMFESDEGYERLDDILAVPGYDLANIGPMDWGVNLGLFGAAAKEHLGPKIEHVIKASVAAGKTMAMAAMDADQAKAYVDLGVRMLMIGVDVAAKRKMWMDQIEKIRNIGT